jgi:hypothetical protein
VINGRAGEADTTSKAASQATPQDLGFTLGGLVFGRWRKA